MQKISNKKWEVFIDNGREPTGKDVMEWASELEYLGAGEILITSIDQEGTKKGFDIDLNIAISNVLNIPIISCGGAGEVNDISELILNANIDAVAIASILHYNLTEIPKLKKALNKNQLIQVRS